MRFKDILIHLRLPFSVFLLPIFLLGLHHQDKTDTLQNLYLFFILHFLVYPASNAYNSYWDKDEGSIGGIKNPPKVDQKLLNAANLLDFTAVILSYIFFGISIGFMILAYILVSRAYSWPNIRIKKYPILSWFIVGFFQGAWVFILTLIVGNTEIGSKQLLLAFFCSILLWSIYPITQIYQHEQDKKAGDLTMSRILGKMGTFYNTFICFAVANLIAYFTFTITELYLFCVFSLPLAIYTLSWYLAVRKNPEKADFKHTMTMNVISSLSLNACFLVFYFI